MRLFILTGGIGCGKSAFASYINRHNVAIVDTDVLARKVVEPGMPGHDAIRAAFGPTVFDGDILNRQRLAEHTFSDTSGELRKKLERCTHPHINIAVKEQLWRLFLGKLQTEGIPQGCTAHVSPAAVCVVIPLYFEAGLDKHGLFSVVPVVACTVKSRDTQISRLKSREHVSLSGQDALNRINSQIDIREKAAKASYVVENDGPIEELEEHAEYFVRHVMPKLKGRRIALATIVYRYFEDGRWNLVLELVLLIVLIVRIWYRRKHGGKSAIRHVLDRLIKNSESR